MRVTTEREITTVPTILYVDDNQKALRMLGAVFQMCGFTVVTAQDPGTALAMAETVAFDLAVLDYLLPDMNGALLAMHIRRVKPDVPLLLFSKIFSLPAEERCLVDEFVSKGESIDLLLYKVRRLLKLRHDHGCSRFDKVDVGCRRA